MTRAGEYQHRPACFLTDMKRMMEVYSYEEVRLHRLWLYC